jgi:hypothetical protein
MRLQPIISRVELGAQLILAVIYLGNTVPKYVLRNLEYLHSTFHENEIYFISDSQSSIEKAAKIGVKTWLSPNPDDQWREIRDKLDHPMAFRQGFWFKTLARLFVLNSFMQLHKNVSCLQIEADVFIFPNFPLSKFNKLDAEIAFPMESRQMGIASLLYLQDHVAAKSFTEFGLNAIQANPQITDMTLLGQIAHSKMLKFEPLPTLPAAHQSALNQPEAKNLVSQNPLDDLGVFDGITIGQYLLGIDARNSRGKLILYRRQHSHAINPEKLNFAWDGKEILSIEDSIENSIIYNLHNHAKDLRIYREKTRNKLLEKRVASSKAGEKTEFKAHIFIGMAIKAIGRRASQGFESKRN